MSDTESFLNVMALVSGKSKIMKKMNSFNKFLKKNSCQPIELQFDKCIDDAHEKMKNIIEETLEQQYYQFNQQIQLYYLQISRQQYVNATLQSDKMKIRQFAKKSQNDYQIPHFAEFLVALQQIQRTVIDSMQNYLNQVINQRSIIEELNFSLLKQSKQHFKQIIAQPEIQLTENMSNFIQVQQYLRLGNQ